MQASIFSRSCFFDLTEVPNSKKQILDFTGIDLKQRVLWPPEALGLCFLNRNVKKSIKLPNVLLKYICELIEKKAFHVMRECAAGESVLIEDARKYFDLQYSTIDAFYQETGMTCSEFLKRSQNGEYILNFITQEFITQFENICFDKFVCYPSQTLYRLPSILRGRMLKADNLSLSNFGYLSPFSLEYFPVWLKYLKIKILNLSSLELIALPVCIKDFKEIKGLNLTHNFLTKLPDYFRELKALEELNISFNKLEELPNFLPELKGLRQLDINGNCFKDREQVVNILKRCESLEQLYISKLFQDILENDFNKKCKVIFF